MKPPVLLALTSAFLVSVFTQVASLRAAEPAGSEKTELEGEWKALSIRTNDEEVPADKLEQMTFTFRGNRHIHTHKTLEIHQSTSAFRVDPTKVPKEIDLAIEDKAEPLPRIAGIYSIEGDRLTIVFDRRARSTRPKSFPKEKAPGMDVIVLKRDAP